MPSLIRRPIVPQIRNWFTSQRELCKSRKIGAIIVLFLMRAALGSGVDTPPAVSEPLRPLLQLSAGFDVSRIEARAAKVELLPERAALRISTSVDPDWAWPGITLPRPPEPLDLSAFRWVMLDIRNLGDRPLMVKLRIDNAGEEKDAHWQTDSVSLLAGETQTLRAALPAAATDPNRPCLFGMQGVPGWAQAEGGGRFVIDSTKITGFVVFVSHPVQACDFEISNLRAGGAPQPPEPTPAQPFPFVDTFGQYKHKDWPGKIHSLEELRARRETEATDLANNPPSPALDEYGGWKDGPALEATGFFRSVKHEGKWWLVDPQGRLYFGLGIHGVRHGTSTPITDRETWFEAFPGQDPQLAFFGKETITDTPSAIKRFAGREIRTYNFHQANLQRKYGPDWRSLFPAVCAARLKSWGINLIGGHSNNGLCRQTKVPYLAGVYPTKAPRLTAGGGYWGDFYDVFSPDFAAELAKIWEKGTAGEAGNPYCIGFFSDNELDWGNSSLHLSLATLRCPATQAAKLELAADLRKKYGEIASLNAAWEIDCPAWEAFLARTEPPAKLNETATADLLAFAEKTADRYFRLSREAQKKAAPNQLYLGCRFSSYNDTTVKAAAKYCDVVSFNLYRNTVDGFSLPEGVDAPVIIGEFHFGALDRGLFSPGLIPTANQQERADSYARYVQSVMKHPAFVGCNWFMYQDQPVTGATYGKGENHQIGFVDTVDTPYIELIAAARRVGGEAIYRFRIAPLP